LKKRSEQAENAKKMLESVNKDLSRKLEALEELKKNLKVKKVEEVTDESSLLPVAQKRWKRLNMMMYKHFPKKSEVTLSVPQRFKLQDLFDSWYEDKNKYKFLFLPIGGELVSKTLSKWQIEYGGKSPNRQNKTLSMKPTHILPHSGRSLWSKHPA
jgi:hypothetical protein